jgi:N-acetylmuramoyl-L-alanine amidase
MKSAAQFRMFMNPFSHSSELSTISELMSFFRQAEPWFINSPNILKLLFRISPLMLILIILSGTVQMYAQPKLDRISVAVRGDGKGYVIRLHLSEAPARFSLIQPVTNLLQFTFNEITVDHSRLSRNPISPISEYHITDTAEGTGIDFLLNDGEYYSGRTYLDANKKHVLIALTRISAAEAATIADRSDIIARGNYNNPGPSNFTGAETVSDTETFPDTTVIPDPQDTFDRLFNQRQGLKFEVIVIDPGHGGKDPGTIGTRGTREKDVALAVAKRIGAYINEYLPGLKVLYTREDDTFVDLDERGRIGNRAQGDLFISIHANSVRSRNAYGTEVWILGMHRTQEAFEVMKRENSVIRFEDGGNSEMELSQEQLMIYELANSGNMASSMYFAELLDHQFTRRAGRRSRGVKQAGFQVLYHASMPAVLVELGFISNPSEERFITSDYGQSILASAVFRAVRDYKEQIERSQKERDTSR